MGIASTLDDGAVRRILADRVDVQRRSVGMVVGLITRDGCRLVSHGRIDHGVERPLDGDTVFELASITKVFTSLLLADMVLRGEVALDDPVARHLPAWVKVPGRKGRQITLVDLATHTSALPLSTDHPGIATPAGDTYSVDQLNRFLGTCELTRDIGSQWEYANVDVVLLGHALAHRAGMDYSELIRARVTGPLGLASTGIDLSPAMAPRLAVSHDADLKPVPRMAFGAYAPAGGMLSSANDLLRLLAIALGFQPPFSPALTLLLQTRRPWQPPIWTMLRQHWRTMARMVLSRPRGPRVPRVQTEQALGWYVHRQNGNEMVVHDGSSATCATSIAYDPKAGAGVVVLSNTGTMVTDISRHLLWGWPLAKARRQISLDPAVLDRYVGKYGTGFGPPVAITRAGDRLVLDFSFVGMLEVRPESERDFFIPEFGLGFRFELDERGQVTRSFFQPGRGMPEMQVKRIPTS